LYNIQQFLIKFPRAAKFPYEVFVCTSENIEMPLILRKKEIVVGPHENFGGVVANYSGSIYSFLCP
jgi:hypothetical protein